MKKSGIFKRNKKNQLGKHLFVYIVAILFVLLLVYSAFENLDTIQTNVRKDTARVEACSKELLQAANNIHNFDRQEEEIRTEEICIWRAETEATAVIERQLANMKISCKRAETLEECSRARILFVGGSNFSGEEIEILQEYCGNGMTLFFSELPEVELLKAKNMQSLLGIVSYEGCETQKGMRMTEKLLFQKIQENSEEFSANVVELQKQTEIYASALPKEEATAKEESGQNSVPLFWRYKPADGTGNVYVADKVLMRDVTGYAVVAFFFQDLYQTFLYPIVNGYCFIVAGMPYTDNFSSEYLQEIYSRDALGVENDILFPEWNRCRDRYNVAVTWYKKKQEQTPEDSDAVMEYYLKYIDDRGDAVGRWDTQEGTMQVDCAFENQLQVWSPGFQWLEENRVQIPYRNLTKETWDSTLTRDLCGIRGMGFASVFVDAERFLREENKENWTAYAKELETILGVEESEVPWLDRITVEEAVYRILAFELMEPQIAYKEDKIEVSIEQFSGEAWFFLFTKEKIEKTKNAEVEEIEEGIYLIKVNEEAATIFFEE